MCRKHDILQICNQRRVEELEENNNHIENFVKNFTKSKGRICVFACGVISLICSFVFMTGTNLNAIPLIYTLLILLGAASNIVYSVDVNGKNRYCGDIVAAGIAICLIGIILRIIQLGVGFAVEYFIAYSVFGIVFIMLGLKITKNKGKKNIIVALLVLLALYSVFEFFYSGNSYVKGFVWRMFHISEATLFLSYAAMVVTDKGDISEKIGKYKSQIPSAAICVVILVFIAVVSIGIGVMRNIDNFDFSSTKKTSQQNENMSDMKNAETSSTPAPKPTSKPTPTPTPVSMSEITEGQTITNNMYEFTLNKVEISHDVMPDNPPDFYSHYTAKPGQVYIYVNASVKNLQKQGIECDEIYSVTADYNEGYTYSGFNIITDTDGNFTYASINSIDPLQTLGVHCLIDCPEEVETSTDPLFLTITFKDGSQYKYTIR